MDPKMPLAQRIAGIAGLARALADELEKLSEDLRRLDASSGTGSHGGHRATRKASVERDLTPLIERLKSAASSEEIHATLAPLNVDELQQVARELGVPFSSKRTRKDELVSGIVNALRRDARMSAITEATQQAFRSPPT